jgi:tetratricopeptide (TPR) repeat protein
MVRWVIVLSICAAESWASPLLDKGIEWYDRRGEGASGLVAAPGPIDSAITAFSAASAHAEDEKDAAVWLLKSYYYKGTFVYTKVDDQKAVFEKAQKIAAQALKKFPADASVNYWSAVVWGRFGEVYGILRAAREGVADRIKQYLEQALRTDDHYDDGAAYALLGRVHFKAPKIPLILTWPSKELAERNIRTSLEMAPGVPARRLFLAELLIERKRLDEARKELAVLTNLAPRPAALIEDRNDIDKGRRHLAEIGPAPSR